MIGDRCSHGDYSLSEGDVCEDDREIECPKHGSIFSLETGEPQSLPATKPVPVLRGADRWRRCDRDPAVSFLRITDSHAPVTAEERARRDLKVAFDGAWVETTSGRRCALSPDGKGAATAVHGEVDDSVGPGFDGPLGGDGQVDEGPGA